jgi:nucleotidyltransferase substrate binding protein (TIGR01987 family)
MTIDDKPRWQYRFDNYRRAYILLQEAIEQSQDKEPTQLEKEGIIQRFEYTIELAWKTMKDWLENQNVVFEQITPRSVVKEAYAAKLIEDGQTWMDALDARNKMSHTYDLRTFEIVIQAIRDRYLKVAGELYFKLLTEVMTNEGQR